MITRHIQKPLTPQKLITWVIKWVVEVKVKMLEEIITAPNKQIHMFSEFKEHLIRDEGLNILFIKLNEDIKKLTD